MAYSVVESGAPFTEEYRAYIARTADGMPVSGFHDIPLHPGEDKAVVNMLVEIPRWSNAKMEICKEERLNPIKQDVKKGKLRFVKNIFPHHGYMWNYGAIPQTWEDPDHLDSSTNAKGDNDPLDVCEIGHKIHPRGTVIQVKILGVMAMIDEGETDWKIIAIDVTDPLASKLNDIGDVETYKPGFLQSTYEWFRDYKVPDGKPKNQFAFDGKAKDKAFAMEVVDQTHQQWMSLISKNCGAGKISCENSCVKESPYFTNPTSLKRYVETCPPAAAAAEIPHEVDMWHYV